MLDRIMMITAMIVTTINENDNSNINKGNNDETIDIDMKW